VQGYSATAAGAAFPADPDHVPARVGPAAWSAATVQTTLMVGPTIAAIDSLCLQCHELAAVTG